MIPSGDEDDADHRQGGERSPANRNPPSVTSSGTLPRTIG